MNFSNMSTMQNFLGLFSITFVTFLSIIGCECYQINCQCCTGKQWVMAKGQHATAIMYLLSDIMLSQHCILCKWIYVCIKTKKGRNYIDRNRIRKHAAEQCIRQPWTTLVLIFSKSRKARHYISLVRYNVMRNYIDRKHPLAMDHLRFLYFFKAENLLILGKTRVFLVQIFWHSEKKTISTTIGNMSAAAELCLRRPWPSSVLPKIVSI